MPCFDAQGKNKEETDLLVLQRRYGSVVNSLNIRTDQLCRTLSSLEENVPHIYNTLPTDIKDWFSTHKEFDKLQKEKK